MTGKVKYIYYRQKLAKILWRSLKIIGNDAIQLVMYTSFLVTVCVARTASDTLRLNLFAKRSNGPHTPFRKYSVQSTAWYYTGPSMHTRNEMNTKI